MPYTILFSILGFALAMIICYFMLPFIIKSSISSGMTTTDHHKRGTPIIAEPGGLAPTIAFIFSFLFVILIIIALSELNFDAMAQWATARGFSTSLDDYLGGILAVVIASLIGLLDDIFGVNLKWRHKIILGFLPALPLMILRVGTSTVNIPLIGVQNFGIYYALLIVPLAMNFSFNAYNMLAGYNGLETGMGIISFITIFIAGIWIDESKILIFSGCILGAIIVLFWFNKYPAKVLIGNTGTLMLGAAVYVDIVLGNVERLTIGIYLLYLINFLMFFIYLKDKRALTPEGFRKKLADIDENESLIPPSPWTVYFFIPFYRKGTKEYTNVAFILALHAIFCMIALALFIISVPGSLQIP